MNQVSVFYRPKALNAARSFSLKENNMKGIILAEVQPSPDGLAQYSDTM